MNYEQDLHRQLKISCGSNKVYQEIEADYLPWGGIDSVCENNLYIECSTEDFDLANLLDTVIGKLNDSNGDVNDL